MFKFLIKGPSNLEKDKGFAWCVLAMSFLSHSLHIGFSFAVLGNLTVAHKNKYGISLQESSTISSVHSGLFFILAPPASVLVKVTSCRVTQILGGISLALGIGLSSLATDPWQTYLLYSVLSALGVAFCYIATSEILALNFNKYKYLAFSLAVLGFYAGMIAWPSVSQNLLENYGYSKTMAIMSALHIVHIVAGVLFFQPKQGQDKQETRAGNDSAELDAYGVHNEALDASKSDVSVSDAIEQESESGYQEDTTPPKLSISAAFKQLLSSAKVWALLANCSFCNANISAFLIMINGYIQEKINLSGEEAALGVTIVGAANLVGCIAVVSTSSLDYDRLILHAVCTFIYPSMTIFIAFSNSKVTFYLLAAIIGLAQAGHIANLLAVVLEFSGADHLVILFGIHLFFEGLGALAGAPLFTYLGTTFGSQYGIVSAGVAGVIGSMSIMPVVLHKVWLKRRAAKDALTAIVLTQNPNAQAEVISEVSEAADPEYSHFPS